MPIMIPIQHVGPGTYYLYYPRDAFIDYVSPKFFWSSPKETVPSSSGGLLKLPKNWEFK